MTEFEKNYWRMGMRYFPIAVGLAVAFFLLITITFPRAAQAGSITISITTGTSQSGVPAGTLTHTETFTDAGLVAQFGAWLIANPDYCPLTGTPPTTPCTLTGANLNTAFQAWAAAFIASTKAGVLRNLQGAAANSAAAGVGPVQ